METQRQKEETSQRQCNLDAAAPMGFTTPVAKHHRTTRTGTAPRNLDAAMAMRPANIE